MNIELFDDLTGKSEMLGNVIFTTQSRALIFAAGVFAGLLDAAEALDSDEALVEANRLFEEEVRAGLEIDMAMTELEQP